MNRWQPWRPIVLIAIATVLTISLFSTPKSVMGRTPTEILWDTWGVPHLYAERDRDLFQAFGYAQMHSHGNLILQLYGQARGRAAEYWGEDFLASDKYVQRMGIPSQAVAWWIAQSAAMRENLTAFVAGINQYAQEHPEAIASDRAVVLPITAVDVLAHIQRAVFFHFIMTPQAAGSNAWAIAPSRSQTGNALLLANPHLPWQDLFLWYEAHLNTPTMQLYGAAFVGMPVLAIAFNDHLGWTATVNTHRGWTQYDLQLAGEGYRWEGEVKPFEREEIPLKVKQADGSLRTEILTVERSLHGPVVRREDGRVQAVRVAGLDRAGIVSQLWQMGQARDRAEFEAALSSLQLPMFNFLYADRAGEIFYVFNALIPERSVGDWATWTQAVPGDTAATLWESYHTYGELPKLANPEIGWLQNSNDPPWSCTFPPALNPANFPAYFAPPDLSGAQSILRTQNSLQRLHEHTAWTLDTLIAAQFDTTLTLPDRVLPDLINVAQQSDDPLAQEAIEVLQNWDQQALPESQGTALFSLWWFALLKTGTTFAEPWLPAAPLTTPTGLADPAAALAVLLEAAQQLRDRYGRLDVTWGEMVHFRVGDQEQPARSASSYLGSFPVMEAAPNDQLEFTVFWGDSYMAAIEFSEPIRAQVLTVYGNATQPHSPHRGDQLELYRRGEMRPVWRDRGAIEAHLADRIIVNSD